MKAVSEIEELECIVESVLQDEEKLISDIKRMLKHAKIRRDYKRLKKQYGWGRCEEVQRELAARYYNNPDREDYIKKIIYHI